MPAIYPPLSDEDFTTVHSFVLDYISMKEKDLPEQEIAEALVSDTFEWGLTIEMMMSYLIDRLTIERGGEPAQRGIMFSKEQKKLKQDIARNRKHTLDQLSGEPEYSELNGEAMALAVDSALVMAIYLPLLADIEKDHPLPSESLSA